MRPRTEQQLLDRTSFREGVFARDKHTCVVCGEPAVDAHHLIERRLFDDGGYYIDNGVSLCAKDHLLAEQTVLTVAQLREAAGINRIVLPEDYDPVYSYSKWGDIEMPSGERYRGVLFFEEPVQKVLRAANMLDRYTDRIKYPRTWHLPWSPGATSDDKQLGDVNHFVGKEVVVTAKLDGENTTFTRESVFARSPDSCGDASRTWSAQLHAQIAYELPDGWRISAENLQAKHAIAYRDLPSYIFVFSIWDECNRCLSWDETIAYAQMLGLETAPVLYRGEWDEAKVRACADALTPWSDENEGYVVRTADAFAYPQFRRRVAKHVREGHVLDEQGEAKRHWFHEQLVMNDLAG